ncbi:hypothetical protein [Actinacidiphila yeochonensis]|uniref:hypothetical protein n=1 Tax=Actinacidiphila yeochonensis TaxID=89050 RepID=UPI00056B5E51|nr:hypothetical protein [Actinacidiphila yeochonensis]
MNPLKGAGIVLALALVAVLVTGVSDVSKLILWITCAIVVFSLSTMIASARRRRQDRRTAAGRGR